MPSRKDYLTLGDSDNITYLEDDMTPRSEDNEWLEDLKACQRADETFEGRYLRLYGKLNCMAAERLLPQAHLERYLLYLTSSGPFSSFILCKVSERNEPLSPRVGQLSLEDLEVRANERL